MEFNIHSGISHYRAYKNRLVIKSINSFSFYLTFSVLNSRREKNTNFLRVEDMPFHMVKTIFEHFNYK